jgi:hypothetical protein
MASVFLVAPHGLFRGILTKAGAGRASAPADVTPALLLFLPTLGYQ